MMLCVCKKIYKKKDMKILYSVVGIGDLWHAHLKLSNINIAKILYNFIHVAKECVLSRISYYTEMLGKKKIVLYVCLSIMLQTFRMICIIYYYYFKYSFH